MFGMSMKKRRLPLGMSVLLLITAVATAESAPIGRDAESALAKMGLRKGVCAVLGLPDNNQPGFVSELAAGSDLLVYFQSPDAEEVAAVRRAAQGSGLLGGEEVRAELKRATAPGFGHWPWGMWKGYVSQGGLTPFRTGS